MIKIARTVLEEGSKVTCNCCSSQHDLYNVTVGRNEDRTTTIVLCPGCRKQMSSMLTKRVK